MVLIDGFKAIMSSVPTVPDDTWDAYHLPTLTDWQWQPGSPVPGNETFVGSQERWSGLFSNSCEAHGPGE